MKDLQLEPSVCISVLNWNGLDDTLECLHSLEELVYDNYQVVVVDNGSKDRKEADMIKEAYNDVHLIKNSENLGFVGGNNQVFQYAIEEGYKYVLLLNNDSVITPDFLSNLVEIIDNDESIGAIGPIIKYYKSPYLWYAGGNLNFLTGITSLSNKGEKYDDVKDSLANVQEVDFVSGCALLVPTNVLKDVGFLGEEFFAYYEEVDFCFRLRSNGYRTVITKESVIDHKVSASAGVTESKKFSPFQIYFLTRNAFLFAKRNLKGHQKYLYLFAQFHIRLLHKLIYSQNIEAVFQNFRGIWDGLKYYFFDDKKISLKK